MRVLITGAGGQLGRELLVTAAKDLDVLAYDRRRLDVTRSEEVERTLLETRPEVVINTAAYTAVDQAELEPDRANAVNSDAAGIVTTAAVRVAARLIHLSTDFVFDGSHARPYTIDATPGPQTAYGRSKWHGEQKVLELTRGRGVVLRTAWLYSRFGNNFVNTMLRLLRQREELDVVADQIGTPTWARGLALALWRLVARPAVRGIHHWTDAGVASWYDFAVAIQDEAAALGLLQAGCAVRPIGSDDFPSRARRPAYSVLDTTVTSKALKLDPIHWRRHLRSMLQDLEERPDG